MVMSKKARKAQGSRFPARKSCRVVASSSPHSSCGGRWRRGIQHLFQTLPQSPHPSHKTLAPMSLVRRVLRVRGPATSKDILTLLRSSLRRISSSCKRHHRLPKPKPILRHTCRSRIRSQRHPQLRLSAHRKSHPAPARCL